jgi:hypothetical protein
MTIINLIKIKYIFNMSNTPPNDDLITEVLNQDPKYVDTRNRQEGDFKQKYKPKKTWLSFNKSTWRNPLFYAPAPAFVLVVAVIGVVAFKNTQNGNTQSNNALSQVSSSNKDSTLVSNPEASSTKVGNAPSPFLPVPKGAQEPDKSMLQSPPQDNPNEAPSTSVNSSPISPNSGTISTNTSNMTNDQTKNIQTPQTEVNKGNPAAVSAQTEVKAEDGSQIYFSYDPNRNQIAFEGKIIAPDTCTVLDGYSLENQNTSFTLKYKLKRTGDICAQIIVEIPISGSLSVQLNQTQVDGFDRLFTIQKN